MNRDRNKKPEVIVQPGWLSLKQAAQYMNCTLSYVQRACQYRRIPFSKVGHRYVLKREDLDAHVESRKRLPAVEYNEATLGAVHYGA